MGAPHPPLPPIFGGKVVCIAPLQTFGSWLSQHILAEHLCTTCSRLTGWKGTPHPHLRLYQVWRTYHLPSTPVLLCSTEVSHRNLPSTPVLLCPTEVSHWKAAWPVKSCNPPYMTPWRWFYILSGVPILVKQYSYKYCLKFFLTLSWNFPNFSQILWRFSIEHISTKFFLKVSSEFYSK